MPAPNRVGDYARGGDSACTATDQSRWFSWATPRSSRDAAWPGLPNAWREILQWRRPRGAVGRPQPLAASWAGTPRPAPSSADRNSPFTDGLSRFTAGLSTTTGKYWPPAWRRLGVLPLGDQHHHWPEAVVWRYVDLGDKADACQVGQVQVADDQVPRLANAPASLARLTRQAAHLSGHHGKAAAADARPRQACDLAGARPARRSLQCRETGRLAARPRAVARWPHPAGATARPHAPVPAPGWPA